MTVALSESDITSVKVGQVATVTISALSGVELGAKVTAISPLGTSSSGVVSYNVTLTVNQDNPEVRPGMSATASIITAQAQGVTVPNQAITGTGSTGTVDVVKNGKVTPTQVIVGLRGTSRSQIISGIAAGAELQVTITLPSLGTSSSSSSTSSGTLGGTSGRGFGGGGFGGGGFGGGGFGGGGFRAGG
jgi:multidrug efflux pump subunit AcrA (membrane-fusion protein)